MRVDVGVMPAIRPEAISNFIRLAYEFRALVWAFVSENGAVDSSLPAVVDELPPDKQGICVGGSQDDLLTGADKLSAPASISIFVATVMTFVEGKAIFIPVFR